MKISWPAGRQFAFTIFDDTDWASIARLRPVYDLLADLGMKTTKSVWIFDGEGNPEINGHSCKNEAYRDWVLSLQRKGFEIALHNTAPVTSPRERTRRGLDHFRTLFGSDTFPHCNHYGCDENLYWGDARLSGWRRTIYNASTRGRRRNRYVGHVEGSPLFWGDLSRERVSYVRNFVFDELNTLSICPEMPYHDLSRPYVNFWFASADGGSPRKFLSNFTIPKIDRLAAAGGLCIAYVHFAAGFAKDGKLDPNFIRIMEYVASRNAWVAPLSQVLDYLRANARPEERVLSRKRLAQIEAQWLRRKILQRMI